MKIGVYYHARIDRKTGGAAVFQETILEEMKRLETEHEIYLFSPTMPEDLSDLPAGLRVVKIEEAGPRTFRSAVRLLKQVMSQGLPAVVDYGVEGPSPLEKAALEHKIDLLWFISVEIEKVTKIPYFATVWDLGHRLHPFFPEMSITDWTWEQRERHYRDLLPRAARVITGTEAGKREIVQFYQVPEDAVEVVPFPTSQFALDPRVADDEGAAGQLPDNFLYYPAQFWPHKNHVGLLIALKLLKEKHGLDFHLVLTGSDKGNLAHVKEKVKELGLSDRVSFYGFVEVAFLKALYLKAYALVFPTFLGPDNLPPLEAFALGCPVVASKVAGAEEQLGDAALLFDPKDPEEMALRIKELHDDPAKREKMIRLGRERALGWTAADYVERMAGIIDDFARVRRCWK